MLTLLAEIQKTKSEKKGDTTKKRGRPKTQTPKEVEIPLRDTDYEESSDDEQGNFKLS